MSWVPKQANELRGENAGPLRRMFRDLQEFLEKPTFPKGMVVGDGVAAYNNTTGIGGQVEKYTMFGRVVQTLTGMTDGLGTLTFNHGLKKTPRICIVVPQAPTNVQLNVVDSYGATTCRAIFSLANTNVTFRVEAVL